MLGDFLDAEPAEKPHLDDLRLTGIELGEPFQSFVEGQNLLVPLGSQGHRVVQGDASRAAAAFAAFVLAGVIDQYAANDLSADGEEMGSPLPLDAGLVDELEIGFVNESRRLEGVIGALAAEMSRSQARSSS